MKQLVLTAEGRYLTMASLIQLRSFVTRLCKEEVYEPTEGLWMFRNGGTCGHCTDGARRVVQAFGGQVVGYFASDNPTALIGHAYCDGHDFALVNGRFVVDYWAFRVAMIIDRPVFDLKNQRDRLQIVQYYGCESNWKKSAVESDLHFGESLV